MVDLDIHFLNDLDGVWFHGPRPQGTLKQLKRGELKLPEPGDNPPFDPKTGLRHIHHVAARKIELMHHARRGLIPESLMGLEHFRMLAELYGRRLNVMAVSGREQDKHNLTHAAFKRFNLYPYFNGGLHLNQGASAYLHKEGIAAKLTGVVLQIDDDLRANLCVARQHKPDINRHVLSYCLDRRGYVQEYVDRSPQITLPDNVVIVGSFKSAAGDFASRLASGQF